MGAGLRPLPARNHREPQALLRARRTGALAGVLYPRSADAVGIRRIAAPGPLCRKCRALGLIIFVPKNEVLHAGSEREVEHDRRVREELQLRAGLPVRLL